MLFVCFFLVTKLIFLLFYLIFAIGLFLIMQEIFPENLRSIAKKVKVKIYLY